MPSLNYATRFQLASGKWVHVPTKTSRELGHRIIRLVRRKWTPPRHFYHLLPGGHVAAARAHQANSIFGKLDLRDFFSAVTRTKIHRALCSFGFNHDDSLAFARESTVATPLHSRCFALPYGFTQSPILASVALDTSALGKAIRSAIEIGVTTSVYVDDIVMSSNSAPTLSAAMASVAAASATSNFTINDAKTRQPSASVDAFNIIISRNALKISNRKFTELADRITVEENPKVVAGILSYADSINMEQANALRKLTSLSNECSFA